MIVIISYFLNITGYKIKKGWSVNLDVVSIHHDPELFPNPKKFDPSRFDVSSSQFPNQQSTSIPSIFVLGNNFSIKCRNR